ncbi:MAG: DUF192 domain-containing protein [Alphaproteobacteria bacterium]|nr:DUF192 domain-containing protein [Alphaproteobacteria bacterium]
MSKVLKLLFVCLLIVACNQDQRTYNFTIVTTDGKVNYKLKNAQTSEEMEKGLMFIDKLPEDEGMIFDVRGYENIAMWMKNTQIPLDMIFSDASGKVVWIYENAIPMSEEYIVPPEEVSFVVEVNGGQVAKYKVKLGDTLKHEFFKNFEKAKERFEVAKEKVAEEI